MPDWLAAFIAAERLGPGFAQIVDHVCRPIADRILRDVVPGRTLVVGLCGAQGIGKSTVTRVLDRFLRESGIAVASLSIDDLYLRRAERERLAAEVHPLLRTRGVPGTHDVPLGIATLAALAAPGRIALPSFDKGRDDRRPAEAWPMVDGPVQVILFEGWCVGARPEAPGALVAPVNRLEREEDADGRWRHHVNAALAGSYRPLFETIDLLVLLAAPGFDAVASWRLEQEHKLRARLIADGAPGSAMSDEQVVRFIAHYERLTRHILREMPDRADLVIRFDTARQPLSQRSNGESMATP